MVTKYTLSGDLEKSLEKAKIEGKSHLLTFRYDDYMKTKIPILKEKGYNVSKICTGLFKISW